MVSAQVMHLLQFEFVSFLLFPFREVTALNAPLAILKFIFKLQNLALYLPC